jgi:hypothetical protein
MIEDRFSARKKIFLCHLVPTISRAHLAFKLISGVAFQGLEWPGREGDDPTPSIKEVKDQQNITTSPPE